MAKKPKSSPLNLNVEKVFRCIHRGIITPPARYGWDIGKNGKATNFPTLGGIALDYKLGDSCTKFVGDHLQPGVSIDWRGALISDENGELESLMYSCCLGNTATVVESTSLAKGYKGYVIGKHGGIENIILNFSDEAKNLMDIGDDIKIVTYGQGLKAKNYPNLHLMNIDPTVLIRMPIFKKGNKLEFNVSRILPAKLMGSGIGDIDPYHTDYDIMTSDYKSIHTYSLDTLNIGDIIAIDGHDCRFGFAYKEDYISIGVIVHGDCVSSGHGPGVVIIATGSKSLMVPEEKKNINLQNYLDNDYNNILKK